MIISNFAKQLFILFITAFLWLPITGFRKANVLSGTQIMERVKQSHAVDTELELIRMVIVDELGNTQTRKLLSVIKTTPEGNAKYLLHFIEPAEIEGVTLLTIEKDGTSVDQYLYLPAIGKARQITGSARSGYFMGSDFTFDDLRKESPEDHKYHRLLDDDIETSEVYVVMSAPANVDVFNATGYEHRLLYIDKTTYDILKIEFYEEGSSVPVKTFQGFDFEGKEVNGPAKRPGRVVMNHNEKGTTSIMTLLKSRLNVPIDESIFDPEGLENFKQNAAAQLVGIFDE